MGFFLFGYSQTNSSMTIEEASAYLSTQDHKNSKDIHEGEESYELFRKAEIGDIIITENIVCRVVARKKINIYNAGYIYLNTNEISDDEIKSITDTIMKNLKEGISFKDLSRKYSMDKNPNAAEMIFSEGQMVPGFEKAVKEHSKGDVFIVETPEEGWYHIVKKNEENKFVNAITVEYVYYR